MLGGIGLPEIIVILVILLLLFGGRKIPQLAKDLGAGIREFKDSLTNTEKDVTETEARPDPSRGAPAKLEDHSEDDDFGPVARSRSGKTTDARRKSSDGKPSRKKSKAQARGAARKKSKSSRKA